MALTVIVTVPQSRALATGEIVEYSWEAGPHTTNWSSAATFPQFDPALGSLLDVTLRLESEVMASMFVENTSTSSGCDATMTWGGVVELDTPYDHLMLDLTSHEAIGLEVFDGSADFAGSSGASFPDLGNTGSDAVVLDGAAAQAFVGTGNVDLGVLAHANAAVAGCGVIQQLFITKASVAVNLSYRYAAGPAIDIEKATNGADADVAPGPVVVEGDGVTWTYVVSNVGDVPLVDVIVADDQGVAVACPQDTLAVGESMTCTGSGVAELGQYANVGAVTGTAPDGSVVTDEDPSHYYGEAPAVAQSPAIDIEKATNGADADVAPGPVVVEGDGVTWTYVVSNVGDVPLVDVIVTDDQGVAVACPQDTLAVGESMTCTGSGVAELGQYANVGAVTGTAPDGSVVTDEDPSHYYGGTITWWLKCDHGDIGCLGIQGQLSGEVLVRVDGEPLGCEVDARDGGEVRFNCMLDGANHPATVTVEVLADGQVMWTGRDLPTACTTTDEPDEAGDAGEETRPRQRSRG